VTSLRDLSEERRTAIMSGNYATFGNYADAEELATRDDEAQSVDGGFEAEETEETRLAGVIIHD
jgi:hypothetical protein